MTFEKNLLGYRLVIVYEPEHDYWKMNCMHIDMEAPGQVWVTEAECYPEEDGRQMLSVRQFLCGVRGAQRLFKPLFQLSRSFTPILRIKLVFLM